MTARPTLTIGIPTYNRRKSVLARLDELFSAPLPEGVDVLVVDNHSYDGTFEAITELAQNNPRLHALQNPKNLGYAGNFLALLRNAKADYLMYDSDEDSIVLEALDGFVEFLTEHHPDFVSPRASCHGRIYRADGRFGAIATSDYRLATFYLSGITYRVSRAMQLVDFVEHQTQTNAYGFLYPQTILLAALLTRPQSFWYPATLTVKQEQLPTHIRNEKGDSYTTPDARVRQGIDLVRFFNFLANELEGLSSEEGDRILEMKNAAARRIPGVLRLSISREMPDLLPGFDEGLASLYKRQSVAHKNLARIKAVIQSPKKVFRLFRRQH